MMSPKGVLVESIALIRKLILFSWITCGGARISLSLRWRAAIPKTWSLTARRFSGGCRWLGMFVSAWNSASASAKSLEAPQQPLRFLDPPRNK